MSVRVAALDCGTHSLRLLIADVDLAEGTLVDVVRTMTIVRLGAGVDANGALAPAAIERAAATTCDYRAIIDAHAVDRVGMVATSAARDASNADEFRAAIEVALGIAPSIISGPEEAELSFIGATRTSGLAQDAQVLVCDIGGGSTELVLGDSTGVVAARSVDVGCVRMTERHVSSDPMTPSERRSIAADVDAALDLVHEVVPWEQAAAIVCVAGTATTIAGIHLELPEYDPVAINGARVPLASLSAISDRLCRATAAERAAIPVMHAGRVPVIAAGSVVLQRVLERVRLPEFSASEHDILDGLALRLAATK